ncbi:hypothetical protein BH11PLA1_BH11PLA1_01620 [soil metagenome]
MFSSALSLLNTLKDLALVVAGFSLIVLIHEAGHFFAARWAGIRVLAFALGFGPALLSYRKGLGVRRGSSEEEYRALLLRRAHERVLGRAAEASSAASALDAGTLAKEAADPAELPEARVLAPEVSPTEYRLNMLPLGGYVKMLGQDDGDPSARSGAPDSYTSARPWKRMIVISAGVAMNVIAAAVLFVIVFTVGLKTEAAMVGAVGPGTPAAQAIAVNGAAAGVSEPGLKAGDEIISIDGEATPSFADVSIAAAMAAPSSAMDIAVRRPGVAELVHFHVTPRMDDGARLMAIGIAPGVSATAMSPKGEAERASVQGRLERAGLVGMKPGETIRAVGVVGEDGAAAERAKGDGELSPVMSAHDVARVAAESGGRDLVLKVAGDAATERRIVVRPLAELQLAVFHGTKDRKFGVEHLLGIAPVMTVARAEARGEKMGLKAGDVFAALGDLQWPTVAEGRAQIQAHKGRSIAVTVWREEGGMRDVSTGAEKIAARKLVRLENVTVTDEGDGAIGFEPGTTERELAVMATWPGVPLVMMDQGEQMAATAVESAAKKSERGGGGSVGTAGTASGDGAGESGAASVGSPNAVRAGIPPGAVITSVAGVPVRTLADIRAELKKQAAGSRAAERDGGYAVDVGFRRTLAGAPRAADPATGSARSDAEEHATLRVSKRDAAALARLGWESPLPLEVFELKTTTLQSSTLGGAMKMGLTRTRNVMLQTYLTFARLAQGTVKADQLRGPVGIAHAGTLLAERGLPWLLFFMAAISINLAVVNFLPLPVVDGGHFLFIVYEQVMGRPVSVAFQNAVTIGGLVLIAGVFLFVTYNDVVRLLGLGA